MKDKGYVLIVDDSVTNQVLLESILNEEDIKTVTVGNPKDAWIKIGMEKPLLILLDILMPNVTGVEFLKELKSNDLTNSIPVFMVTAANTSFYKEQCEALDVDEFFAKPINIKEFVSKVKKILIDE